MYIVLEYAAGGDLRTALEKRQNYHEADACTAFRSLLKALEYLHSRGIVHRDLKVREHVLGQSKPRKRFTCQGPPLKSRPAAIGPA